MSWCEPLKASSAPAFPASHSLSDLIPFTETRALSHPLSPSAGNAAVVKPSELSEYSALLLRALLPRYLDKV